MSVSHALLGYSPVIDKRRVVIATRLAMRAANPAHSLVASPLYRDMAKVWPDGAGPVIVDADDVAIDDGLLGMDVRENIWLSIPATLMTTERGLALLEQLHRKGLPMVLHGAAQTPLPAGLAVAFRMMLIEAGGSAAEKGRQFVELDVVSLARMDAAFAAGAHAVAGFPVGAAGTGKDRAGNNPSFDIIGKLIKMVNAGAEPADMDKVIRQDPALAFRLLRFLNSPAFGLRVEVQSIQHAIMMLGIVRLRKWLALLLSSAATDPNLKPLMFASLRRGFLLETLVGDAQGGEGRDEAFILGVFSLLDQLFGEPFDKLFERLQIPESVHDALVNGNGAFMPYLKVARALERAPGRQTQDVLTESFIGIADCNRALIAALANASVTESGS